jgi:chitinase
LTVRESGTPTNRPPLVSLTAPTPGAQFTAPATIALAASASDPEGRLASVRFYAGTTLLATDTTAPHSFSWSAVPAGTYSLTALAEDADGESAMSAAVPITVAAAVSPPRYVVFTASTDHNSSAVTSYLLEIFASGANPDMAVPLATSTLGKPAPATNGDITVDRATFFSGLAAGSYVATVSAVGPGGTGRSAPITFTR